MHGLFRSKFGTRWFIIDQIIGILAFTLSWYITPLTSNTPAIYYLILVGWCWGLSLASFSRITGVPNSGTHYGINYYEVIAVGMIATILSFAFFNTFIGIILARTYDLVVLSGTFLFSLISMVLLRVIAFKVTRLKPKNLFILGNEDELTQFITETKGLRSIKVRAFGGPQHHIATIDKSIHYHDHPITYTSLQSINIDSLLVFPSMHEHIDEKVIFDLSKKNISIMTSGFFFQKFCKKIIPEFMSPSEIVSLDFTSENKSALFVKRSLELTIAILVLLICLPLFPIISILIKLDSSGPIFYSQNREGFKEKNFKIYKFRTMVSNAEKDGAQWAKLNDHRVTKLGRFLRKSRIDELPQLFNVIKGEMSLIGPRPERPEFTCELKEKINFYQHRCLLPPGLTGWAQLMYRYGSSEEDAKKKLQYDLYYIKNFSIAFDIEILLKTIPLLMKGSR